MKLMDAFWDIWQRKARKKERHQRQLEALFAWLSTIVHEDDAVEIDLPFMAGYFYFRFPLKEGDAPRRIRRPERSPTFIIRCPRSPAEEDSWKRIFAAPDIEILENTARLRRVTPLRWGLADRRAE